MMNTYGDTHRINVELFCVFIFKLLPKLIKRLFCQMEFVYEMKFGFADAIEILK